jgi:cardiolipin synthase A/B
MQDALQVLDRLPELAFLLPWINYVCTFFVIYRAAWARVTGFYILFWISVAILIPKSAALILFIWGGRKYTQLARNKREVNAVAKKLTSDSEIRGNRFTVLGDEDGKMMLETLLKEIRQAQKRIHIETYILKADAIGREIISALAQRARAGVEVRLLLDGVGSWGTPWFLCQPLIKAGGEVAQFNPIFPMQGRGSANWRNHRKIALFDGQTAVIGGQNISLNYLGYVPSNRRYRDCSFLIDGPAEGELERVFIADWCQATNREPKEFLEILRHQPQLNGETQIKIISSGPDCIGDPLWETYIKLIENAEKSITIMTPYFVPDRTLYQLLLNAAQKNIKVKIILPRRSDHRLLDFARRWYLRKLKESGAQILFYKSGVLHAKLFMVDDETAVVGSANLDMRSLFFNYEIAACINHMESVNNIGDFITSIERECSLYSEDIYQKSRTWRGQALEAVSKLVAPLL